MECNSKCVYLSPSTQQFNQYDGGGNEEEYMNIVTDSIENYLNEYGICYKRNNPSMTVNEIVADSNSGDYILHLAIHSNASGEGNEGMARGTEVYYYPLSNTGGMFAKIIENNFKEIYPDSTKVTTKTSLTFAELRRTKATSVLVEVAFHDNPEDANWIRNNTDKIGEALALSIKEYIDEFCKCPKENEGEVITLGGNLNIRSGPDLNSQVITSLPNGTKVEILSCNGHWYKIKADSIEGYAFKHYIGV